MRNTQLGRALGTLAPAAVGRWHISSQHRARRNALVAATALAQRRRERLEVEEFLASHVSSERQAAASGTETA